MNLAERGLKQILILDDSENARCFMADALKLYGYKETHLASNVKEALAIIAALKGLDFAIIDLMLEGEYGSELSNGFIREHIKAKRIPYARFSSASPRSPAFEGLIGLGVIEKQRARAEHKYLLEFFKLIDIELGVSDREA